MGHLRLHSFLTAAVRAAVVLAATVPVAAQPLVTWTGETMSLASATVSPQGAAWHLSLVMADDNGNGSLPSSYRRWWHCQISNLNAAAPDTLNVQVSNAGYTDIILPVWSLKAPGGTWSPYVRLPLSAVPTYSSGTHSFSVVVPAGISEIRLAKYFPYTVVEKDQFVASLTGNPLVTVTQLGVTPMGRPITRLAITDGSVPLAGKPTVWIHAGIHPAETTSYPVVEGLVNFLLSGDPRAQTLVQHLSFEIIPMANPDGVALGNYRTNGNSVNLETQWAFPYSSNQPEVVALRTRIETLMGTAQQPGSNPIEVILNLHSSHGVNFPFHYRHTANAGFDIATSPSGVVPSVNQLETNWITAFEQRSPFVNIGSTLSSSCGAPGRSFVECMMHDRWSIDPTWTGGVSPQAQVMAITFEGTYRRGPDTVTWNTPDDYRQVGQELALALADYFSLLPSNNLTLIGTHCSGALPLTSSVASGGGASSLTLTLGGVPSGATAWLISGPANIYLPLGCPLLLSPDVLLQMPVSLTGDAFFSVPLQASLSFTLNVQAAAVDLLLGPAPVFSLSDAFVLSVAW